MRSSATHGTPPRLTAAAFSGRIRSKAAAKIARVEERYRVPQKANRNMNTASRRITWKAALFTTHATIATGDTQSPFRIEAGS